MACIFFLSSGKSTVAISHTFATLPDDKSKAQKTKMPVTVTGSSGSNVSAYIISNDSAPAIL
ncbi:MAG TPA: hypothetical protein VNW95_02875 [Mucilaginibacter sp.]|nr:hypothetical protein [Mucilaginibacter sp.]